MTVRMISRSTEVLTAFVSGARAILGSPSAAADHPAALELQSLLNEGFRVVDVQGPHARQATTVTARRGGEVREVTSGDLAFAVYATRLSVEHPASASRRAEALLRD